jgi:hypothetical protein
LEVLDVKVARVLAAEDKLLERAGRKWLEVLLV